jgi:dTMP kinase
MDLRLAREPTESFRLFQSRVLDIYDALTREFDLKVIDATREIDEQQRLVRQLVLEIVRGVEPKKTYGRQSLFR